MARLTLVPSKRTEQITKKRTAEHRAATSEGEAAIRLLESAGYPVKRRSNGQAEVGCPFHEEPGEVPRNKKSNFYIDTDTSRYFCHSVTCGARGNLQMLERFFGVNVESSPEFMTREKRLQEYEAALTVSLMDPFFEHGLTESTVRRFRFGWSNEKQAYVLPYLQSKRPVAFRYYNPNPTEGGLKYWWEKGSNAQLFNVDDSVGDDDGRVFIAEGEMKAALLTQLGYASVAVPGASTFKDEWFSHFNHVKSVVICFDNDNPLFHVYENCHFCTGGCIGHNPGQEAATKLVQKFDWRGKNVLLPLPDEGLKKTDVNEFFIRDGKSAGDFAELALGVKKTPYIVQSLAEIEHDPPEESEFLIEQGILVKGGRLLVSGSPKCGKSIAVQQMALSLGAGIPYLRKFEVAKPTRVMLLDRELSRRALWDRFGTMIQDRPGYRAAMENVLVDHDHMVRFDREGTADVLTQLIEQNGVEVLFFDTAYKFFGGDMRNESALSKAFETLDKVIHETGCSIVLTHHMRKGQRGDGKDDSAHPDQVAGSFLWTGWPNGTILINFLERRVEDPFNTVWHFTAFRDAAPPPPIAVYRDRDSIAYTAIKDYDSSNDGGVDSGHVEPQRPTTEIIEKLLLRMCPIVEEDFLHAAATKLGVRHDTVRPYYIDAMSKGYFEKRGRPPVIRYVGDVEEETWEEDHNLTIEGLEELV